MKYRIKPVEVEAVQLRWGTWGEVCELIGKERFDSGEVKGTYVNDKGEPVSDFPGEGMLPDSNLGVLFNHGDTIVLALDYLVRHADGSIQAMDPVSFKRLFEAVD